MTLYGESEAQFRPRPSRARLALFVAASTILSAWLAALLSNLVSQAAATVRLVGRTGVPVALFPAGPPDLPGMHAVIDPARLAVAPLLMMIVAVLMIALWPSSGTLASRISVTITARTLALSALTDSLSQSPLEWLSGDLSAIGLWRPIIAIGSIILIWRSEGIYLALLSMFYDLERPSRRAVVWSAASLPQWLVWFLFALAQWHTPGMVAAAVATIVTITAGAGMRQSGFWEKVARPYLVEDTIIAAAAALALTIGGFATFGAPLLGVSRQVVVLGSSPVAERIPLDELQITVAEEPLIVSDDPADETSTSPAQTKNEEEPVIDIRWSKDRDQKAQTQTKSDSADGEQRQP